MSRRERSIPTAAAHCLGLIATCWLAGPAAAAPDVEIQSLKWFVIYEAEPQQGDELSVWQARIEQAAIEARALLQGFHGPADVPCCVDFSEISVTQVIDASLFLVDSDADFDALDAICIGAGGGSCAFLVDTLTWCSGPGTPIGCADTPSCLATLPDDDPNLTLVVTRESYDLGLLSTTLAHERGHNACLCHVDQGGCNEGANDVCNLMRSSGGGGCIDEAQCGLFEFAGNAAGGTCQCQTDSLGTVSDGTACTEVSSGICSGGICAEPDSDGAVQLFAAGGPESVDSATPDDPLLMSGLPGGWTDLGSFDEIQGLEYAPGRDVLYGTTAADELVTINPSTGAITSTVGTLPSQVSYFGSGSRDVVYRALAFDPGPTGDPGDDRLIAIASDEVCSPFCQDTVVSIDPDDASLEKLFDNGTQFSGGLQGLAYDSVNGRLFASSSSGSGLRELDLDCTDTFCSVATVQGVSLPRLVSGLAYSASTGSLYLLGSQSGDRFLYTVIDATTLVPRGETIPIDSFTIGGLAAVPVPEPALGLLLGAALLSLACVARRRLA